MSKLEAEVESPELEPEHDPEEEEEDAAPPAPRRRAASVRDELRALWPSAAFVVAWLTLNVLVNLRYPEAEPKLWYFTPAFDVTAMFAVVALFGWFRRKVPLAVHVAFVAFLVLVRLVRSLDALGMRELSRPLNFYIDVPMLPELWRLGYWTLPLGQFVLVVIAVPALIAGLAAVAHYCLRTAERYLRHRAYIRFFALLAGVLALISVVKPKRAERYLGVFGSSGVPRLFAEVDFVVRASGYRATTLGDVDRVERELGRSSRDLAGLAGANVLLFFVESYGQTVLDRSEFRSGILQTYTEVERALADKGFSVASGVVLSPAYGGGSWLAHATLATGVRTGDQFQHDLVMARKPKTLDQFFRDAGYRTIAVEPATTRPVPARELGAFEERYYAAHLGYRGPRFDWATMPDQYVLDFLRKKRFTEGDRPVFLECVLISSHAPWRTQPRVIDGWDGIGDGSVYANLPPVRFDVTWSNMEEAGPPAYLRSIQYELEVLKRFIADVIDDESLIVILGDHQPIAEITHYNYEFGVPMHVVSRNQAFVDRFVARGYARGMLPLHGGKKPRSLDRFLPDFLSDFSTPR